MSKIFLTKVESKIYTFIKNNKDVNMYQIGKKNVCSYYMVYRTVNKLLKLKYVTKKTMSKGSLKKSIINITKLGMKTTIKEVENRGENVRKKYSKQ